MRVTGYVALCLFVGTVVAANWAVDEFGVVSVGFGLVAPAGVYFAGLALLLRDVVQRCLGRGLVLAAIVVGAGVSAAVDTTLALASGLAFLTSELADFSVYTPLERRHGIAAVVCSNAVGAAVDSLLFLWIAFGSLEFFWGQWVGKMWITAAALPFLLVLRRRLEGSVRSA